MRINAIATQVKAVLSVEIPKVKKTSPRMRKIVDEVRLFSFIDSFYAYGLGWTSAYGLVLSNKVVALPFNVASKNDNR